MARRGRRSCRAIPRDRRPRDATGSDVMAGHQAIGRYDVIVAERDRRPADRVLHGLSGASGADTTGRQHGAGDFQFTVSRVSRRPGRSHLHLGQFSTAPTGVRTGDLPPMVSWLSWCSQSLALVLTT